MGAPAHRDHGHDHHVRLRDAPRRALTIALALIASFMVVEVAVALWSGSLALLADAGHMLGDSGALALALLMSHVASRPRSPRKTYGYRRAEVMGAFVNAVALLGVSAWVVFEAVGRFAAPPDVKGAGMLGAAIVGLAINLLAAWVLAHGGGSSINVRAAMFHVLGDALGSMAALIAGALVVWVGWQLADPIASLVIAVLLVAAAVRLLLESTHVLMEGTPEDVDVEGLERTILETPGVASVHDLHVWSLTPGEPVLTAHVVVEPGAHGTDVVRLLSERLFEQWGIAHVTIQPEAPPPEEAIVQLRIPQRDNNEAAGE